MYPVETLFLIVDDTALMRNIVKNALTDMGYTRFVEAVDGLTALETLENQISKNDPVQFIISDWNMPKMSGLELLKKCSETLEFTNLPFILVTAEGSQDQIIQAAKVGVSDYILKPFTFDKIKEKLERVYKKRHPFVKSPN